MEKEKGQWAISNGNKWRQSMISLSIRETMFHKHQKGRP